jgi:hypothetical protein
MLFSVWLNYKNPAGIFFPVYQTKQYKENYCLKYNEKLIIKNPSKRIG